MFRFSAAFPFWTSHWRSRPKAQSFPSQPPAAMVHRLLDTIRPSAEFVCIRRAYSRNLYESTYVRELGRDHGLSAEVLRSTVRQLNKLPPSPAKAYISLNPGTRPCSRPAPNAPRLGFTTLRQCTQIPAKLAFYSLCTVCERVFTSTTVFHSLSNRGAQLDVLNSNCSLIYFDSK